MRRPLAVAAIVAIAVASSASSAARAADAPAAPRKLLPDATEVVLPNGMRLFLVPDHEVPMVTFQMRLAGGSVEDPAGKEGATALLASLLTKGAGDRDAAKFDEDVEFVGGAFGASAGQRWITVSGEFMKQDADLALELFSDVLTRPRLDAAEFEKERGRALDGFATAREEPQAVIGRYWSNWVFGAHPLGRPSGGDEVSVRGLTADDVRAAAKRQLSPKRAWFAVAGDFDPADIRKRVEARLGAWTSDSAAPAALPEWKGTPGGRVLLVDKPDALQTYFFFGNRGFDWKDPDYPARFLANTILGGRFTSRLNKVLRTEKGLTYGASSGFDDDRFGEFLVSTYTETARSEECLTLAEQLYRKFLAEGLTAEELESAKSYLKGQYAPNNVETGSQQAHVILDLAFGGVPRAVVGDLFANLDAVTLEIVNRVVKERFPQKLDWVVVGNAETCRPFLAKFGKVTECRITDPGWGPRAE
jgi:predicted Zn-dependent peptidase